MAATPVNAPVMTLAATSGDPADTHIVGAPDPNSALDGKDYEGRGPNAVRCIRLEKAAASGGAVIRGFTIRDGYSAQRYNGDAYGASDALLAAQPGGVTSFSADYANFYVTDCVITSCYGVRGGLVRYGRYVRCRFADGHGGAGASLGRNIKVLSSLILKMPGACADNSTFVNCTFADGNGAALHLNSGSLNNTVFNTIVSAMGAANFEAKDENGTAKNSVFDRQPFTNATDCHEGIAYPLFAPRRGDFRLRADGGRGGRRRAVRRREHGRLQRLRRLGRRAVRLLRDIPRRLPGASAGRQDLLRL